jgi:hypothetical protein
MNNRVQRLITWRRGAVFSLGLTCSAAIVASGSGGGAAFAAPLSPLPEPVEIDLLPRLGPGNDVGPAAENDPSVLVHIGQEMRAVEALIRETRSDAVTQTRQQQIVSELERLLEQSQKQCQGCCQQACQGGGGKPGAGAKPGGESQQAPQGKPGVPGQPGKGVSGASGSGASKSGTPKPGSSQPVDAARPRNPKPSVPGREQGEIAAKDGENPDDLVKRVWGQLPDRLRDQVQQAPPEEFLPAYRELIEAYYRRLAEEQPGGP